MTSLRRALLLTLVAATAVVTAVELVATYRIARGEIDAVLDYQLRLIALSLRDQALGFGRASALGAGDRELVVEIWDEDGVDLVPGDPVGGHRPDQDGAGDGEQQREQQGAANGDHRDGSLGMT